MSLLGELDHSLLVEIPFLAAFPPLWAFLKDVRRDASLNINIEIKIKMCEGTDDGPICAACPSQSEEGRACSAPGG